MAKIVVVRGTSRQDHNLADDDSKYKLPKLRAELERVQLMFPGDMFFNGDSKSTITGDELEQTYSIAEVFTLKEETIVAGDPPVSTVTRVPIREVQVIPGEESVRQITVLTGGGKSLIQFDTRKTLLDLRNHLDERKLIKTSERFSINEAVIPLLDEGRTFLKAFEAVKTDAANIQVTLVAGAPSTQITVDKGQLKKLYTVEDTATLASFRETLIRDRVMVKGDTFQVGGTDLAGNEQVETVKHVAIDGKLSIKYTAVLGPDIPKITLPPPPSTKVEWGQTVTYTKAGGANPSPVISGGTFDGKVSDVWPMLTWEQKRYVFSLLTLGRAIVIGPEENLMAAPRDSLVKSTKNAVWLEFPSVGPNFTMPDRSFWGKFRSTFSLAVHEVHKRAATSTSVGGGVKGAALVSEFGMIEESTQHKQTSKVYNSQLFCKPVVTLYVDVHRDVSASDEFTRAIRETLTEKIVDQFPERTRYFRLLRVLLEYGHYLPVAFDLGGAMGFSETIKVDKKQTTTMKSFSSRGKVEGTVKGVELNTGFTREDSHQDAREFQDEDTSSEYFMIGGDAATYSTKEPKAWLESLKKHEYWRVIGYGEFTPVIRFLEPILLAKTIALLKDYAADPETSRYAALDVMEYALVAQATLTQAPGQDLYD